MLVVYRYLNQNSLTRLYVSNDGETEDIGYACRWNSIEDVRNDYDKIKDHCKYLVRSEWFIGELEPTCKGYLGEFGGEIDG